MVQTEISYAFHVVKPLDLTQFSEHLLKFYMHFALVLCEETARSITVL